jgi:shikimate dehydrogenase
MGRSHHVDFEMKVFEWLFVADVEQMTAVTMGDERAIFNLPGVGMFFGLFPAVKSFAIEELDEAFFGIGSDYGLRGRGTDNGRACEKQIEFHAAKNRGMISQFQVKKTRGGLTFEVLGSFPYNHRVSGPFSTPIDANTRYCAVFGHPIKHSASPAMQNAGIATLGLNWRYLAFEVHPDDLRPAIEGAKRMNFVGLNLTVPHKLLALEFVDALDESAKLWGAVNTIRFEGKDSAGRWQPLREFADVPREIRSHGFNTDADAIMRALKEDLGINLADAKVLQLGAGGAGRTAALKLASENISELYLINRTQKKAEDVAAEIRNRNPKVKVHTTYPSGKIDLLVNATSLGLKSDDALPYSEDKFDLRRAEAVYDMIYRPAQTLLLQSARDAGCRTANGIGMLLYQGAKALEIWTGQTAPIDKMRQALEKNVYG